MIIAPVPAIMLMMRTLQSCIKRTLVCKILDPAQQQSQLVHPMQRELELAVAREEQTAEGGVQLLAIERGEAVLGVFRQQLLCDGADVAPVEVCE